MTVGEGGSTLNGTVAQLARTRCSNNLGIFRIGMRSAEERIEALHSRMEDLQKAKERRINALLGTGCCMLTIDRASNRGDETYRFSD